MKQTYNCNCILQIIFDYHFHGRGVMPKLFNSQFQPFHSQIIKLGSHCMLANGLTIAPSKSSVCDSIKQVAFRDLLTQAKTYLSITWTFVS